MTQEDKQLLLKDLSMRLRYNVRLEVKHCRVECNHHLLGVDGDLINVDHYQVKEGWGEYPIFIDNWMPIEECKPYLRPMSSMTEEEKKEFAELFYKWHDDELFDYIEEGVEFSIWKHKGISPVIFDWLNAHHFDYRGLIPMCLALEAPEGMYDTKTE